MSSAVPPLPPILGLLDIGTSKIVCMILARSGGGEAGSRVIGFGHQRARGLKASVIVDADAAEDAVRATIAQAEHMAGTVLEDVVIAAACGRMMSTHVAAGLDLDTSDPDDRSVTAADIERLIEAGRTHAERDDRAVLDIRALAARVDGRPLPGLAVGAFGRRLSVDVHAVAADRGPLRHLLHVAERCQLHVRAVAPAPLAAALAVTTADERRTGVTVIDLGAGATSLAVYAAGNLVGAHVFPIGSNHLTFDLTRALGVSITEAERIKKKYAIQPLAHPAPDELVEFLPREDDHATALRVKREPVDTKQVTRADISTILTSRLNALLRQILQRVDQLAIPPQFRGDVVLTGGGSLLSGLAAHAATILGRPVRVAAPLPHSSLPRTLLHPAFATVAGLEFVAGDRGLGLRFDNMPLSAASVAAGGSGLRRSF